MNEELEYHYWKKLLNQTKENLSQLDFRIECPELKNCYYRKVEIYEEILQDLSPQLDDPQYSGTTSWGYEEELKTLKEQEENLETQYDLLVIQQEKQEHLDMLKEIGWTQEQYDAHQEELYAKPKPKVSKANPKKK